MSKLALINDDVAVLEPDVTDAKVIALPGLADKDLRAIVSWVTTKIHSPHTQRAFMIEAQRWLAWLIWQKACAGQETYLDKAATIDANAYLDFLKRDVNKEFPKFALIASNLRNQPFRKSKLGRATIARAVHALRNLYEELEDMITDHPVKIEKNPFRRIKVKSISSDTSLRSKALTKRERNYVQLALEKLKEDENLLVYHQYRWIWSALLLSALRRSELANARACDIFQDPDESEEMGWMLGVLGKGDIDGKIPLNSEFMEEFKLYRSLHGLSPLPTRDDDGQPDSTPLVLPIRGTMWPVSDQLIYRAMKRLMGLAAAEAEKDDNPAAMERFLKFGPHSGRHTCVTMLVDATGDITLGKEMARHGSISTTQRYKATATSRLRKAMEVSVKTR